MKWSTKQRYRTYDSYSENDLQSLRKLALKSPWKSNFHIEPETGLLNDPNGFSYFNGKWHLFYQHFPFGPVHGLKSWVHLVSDDLVHFEKTGLVLYPDTKYDNAGAYSGSALAFENSLFLIYTGNHRGKDWVRTPYQLGAKVDKNNQLIKFTEPLIFPDFSQTTDHFRDPQIFSFQGQIYCLIGAQSSQKNGIIKLYKAIENNLTDWKDLGNLDFSKEKMGYMIECPNLIFVNGRSVLVFCPQGLDKSIVKYDNIYPNMYVIADDFTTGSKNQLKNAGQLINLDEGFDCYATQSFNAPDGSAYAISWLGLPETSYPTDKYNVQGVLSMVKKLSIKDNKLYQYPVEKMKELRQKEQDFLLADNNIITSNSYELEVDFRQQTSTLLSLMTNEKGDSALKVEIDKENNTITLIRNYEKRLAHVKIEKMNVFIDQSIFEIFINDGEKVLSGRVFPNKNQYSIRSQKSDKNKIMGAKKVIKLEDVANKAGVSVTTVSRVINRKGYLSDATISKVEKAMQDLHYIPNAAARSLQGKSLKLIGLVFPTIKNIFYAELIEKIEQALFKRGYKAMLATTEHDEQKERDYLALLLSNQVDGIIYGSHNLKAHDYIAIEAPIVAFDRLLTPETTVVSSDNFEGGILATKALINSGSKKIAIFTGNDNTNSPTYLRRDGYLLELERNQLKPHIIKIPSQWTLLRKKVEIKKILENNDFDGVFCTDDLTAILVKDLASNLKKSLNVVGFDGTEFIENYYPNLTTIKQPINDLAELLVDLIIRKIDGDNIDITYQLPVQLHYGID